MDALAAFEGSGERDLVGVFEVSSDGQARGEPRDRHAQGHEEADEVGGRGLSLDVRVGGEDDFRDGAVAQPLDELADAKVFGPDPLDGVDGASQDVVAAAEFAGSLDGHDVFGLFDHADHRAEAALVGADGADVGLGDVSADLAEPHALLDFEQGVGERLNLGGVFVEDVEGDALGALGADPGQVSEFVDELLDGAVVDSRHLLPSAGLVDLFDHLALEGR